MKRVLITLLALFILGWLVPVIKYDHWLALVLAAFVLTLLNVTVKPLLQLLFLPMNIITLGLFGWLIHGVVLGLAFFLIPSIHLQLLQPFGFAIGYLPSLMILAFALTMIERGIDFVI